MTVIFIDRNNLKLMESINKLFYNFNIKNKNTFAYQYCLNNKETCGDWINHFYETEDCDNTFIESSDGTDTNAITKSIEINRFKHYTDFLEKNNDELVNSLYNCFSNELTEYDI